jgi:hypothetical protein
MHHLCTDRMDIVMRIVFGVIAAVAVGFVSPAQATDPPTSAAPQPQATTTAPPAAPATSTDTTDAPSKADGTKQSSTQSPHADVSSKVKVTAGDSEAEAQLKRFRSAGYKPEVHDGNVVFCRREVALGSRFDKKICTTAHLLEQQMATAQDTLSTAQRNGTLGPRSN